MLPKKNSLLIIIGVILGITLLALFWGGSFSSDASTISFLLQTILASDPKTTPSLAVETRKTAQDPPVGWLEYLNDFRTSTGLTVVTEMEAWSESCRLHSQYMVKNDFAGHTEDSNNEWYTREGATAARNSNVMVSSTPSSLDKEAIDLWLSQPFHGIGILDPQLSQVGFGSYRDTTGSWRMGATMDIISGHTNIEPSKGTYPVIWPPEGQTTSILAYQGSEWPDPLTSCPGYTAPSGPPVYLQIGSGSLIPEITATSFQENDRALNHCVFDETSYHNTGENDEQQIGRDSLGSRDAIILIPEKPLIPGNIYTVSITANGRTYKWSFTATR